MAGEALRSCEASRRNSLDNILKRFGKRERSERRKGSEDDKKEEEDGRIQGRMKRSRGETDFKTKRMRTNAGNTFRQDITVNKKSKY